MILEKNTEKEALYLKVYRYYRDLIFEKKLLPGAKMPSLRRCSSELQISRTTAEAAYLTLAAEGYIIARPQSGYYVTDIAQKQVEKQLTSQKSTPEIRFDFRSSGSDPEGFRFDLWRRYIKSALRQDERLLGYGEPQGERELRETLALYVREHRNILCSADDIVIGAGTQSLLHILCPLVKDRHTVSFPTTSFVQGSTIFEDYGFEVHYRDKSCEIIYVSPAHMTRWGALMPISRRLELVRHAKANNCLIIEDDYENEFVRRPTPSLHSLSGGENVVYMGSFSRLLLPSIRIGFLVLPPELCRRYQRILTRYSQTASKTEQIALCQFIRDGHLLAQTRKLRRLYNTKLEALLSAIQSVFGKEAVLQTGEAGISVALSLKTSLTKEQFLQEAQRLGLKVEVISDTKISSHSCSPALRCPQKGFLEGCELIKKILSKGAVV